VGGAIDTFIISFDVKRLVGNGDFRPEP
jgi:hypothetical protein